MTTSTSTQTSYATRGLARTVGIVLAAAGLLDAAYLSWLHFADKNPVLCTEGGGCDIVQNSVYAEVGGLPVALLGLGGYAFIVLTLLLDRYLSEWGPIMALAASLIGTLYSAYLTYLELFILHATCPYCVASAVFMVGLLVVAVYRLRMTWLESPA